MSKNVIESNEENEDIQILNQFIAQTEKNEIDAMFCEDNFQSEIDFLPEINLLSKESNSSKRDQGNIPHNDIYLSACFSAWAYSKKSNIEKHFPTGTWKLITKGDLQALVINYNSVLIIAFRGTVNLVNVARDILVECKSYPEITKCEIHRGFGDAYIELRNDVKAAIDELDRNNSTRAVYVTGHSLGGAMATLCALDLRATMKRTEHSYWQEWSNPRLVTFGQPRVGGSDYAKELEERLRGYYVRVVNLGDIIPELPPKMMKWKHGGGEYKIDFPPLKKRSSKKSQNHKEFENFESMKSMSHKEYFELLKKRHSMFDSYFKGIKHEQ